MQTASKATSLQAAVERIGPAGIVSHRPTVWIPIRRINNRYQARDTLVPDPMESTEKVTYMDETVIESPTSRFCGRSTEIMYEMV